MLASTITPLPQEGSASPAAGGASSLPPRRSCSAGLRGWGEGQGKGEEDPLSLSFGG